MGLSISHPTPCIDYLAVLLKYLPSTIKLAPTAKNTSANIAEIVLISNTKSVSTGTCPYASALANDTFESKRPKETTVKENTFFIWVYVKNLKSRIKYSSIILWDVIFSQY